MCAIWSIFAMPRHSRHVLEALHTHRIPEAPKQHTFWMSLLSDAPVSGIGVFDIELSLGDFILKKSLKYIFNYESESCEF